MIDSGKKITSFVVGTLILAIGLIPLLNRFNVISFESSIFAIVINIAFWILAAGGIFILIDAHLEGHSFKVPSTIVGILLLIIGLVEILYKFGILQFHIPFLTEFVFYILFVIEGIFLVIGAFAV